MDRARPEKSSEVQKPVQIVIFTQDDPLYPPHWGHPEGTFPPRPTPMAMMLTRCEQAWVDDVRARRQHVHLRDRT